MNIKQSIENYFALDYEEYRRRKALFEHRTSLGGLIGTRYFIVLGLLVLTGFIALVAAIEIARNLYCWHLWRRFKAETDSRHGEDAFCTRLKDLYPKLRDQGFCHEDIKKYFKRIRFSDYPKVKDIFENESGEKRKLPESFKRLLKQLDRQYADRRQSEQSS